MDVVTGVELECSYGAGDGWTRSRVASMPKERSGGPRLDWSCDWEKYGYDTWAQCSLPRMVLYTHCHCEFSALSCCRRSAGLSIHHCTP